MNFADTNWLVAIYVQAEDRERVERRILAERFMRRHGDQLVTSHTVLLEARNVFSRVTGEPEPEEWRALLADFGGRIYVDPMNWDVLRRECNALFARYAWKTENGTLDTSIVASAKLAGATQFLSFDARARAIAAAESLQVFPALDAAGRQLVAMLKRSGSTRV